MKKPLLLIILIIIAGTVIKSTDSKAWDDSPPLRTFDCYHEFNGVLENLPYARNIRPGQSCPSVPPSAAGHNKNTPTDHECRVVIDNVE